MCGIIGAFYTEEHKTHSEWMKQGLVCSSLRGTDATGIFITNGEEDFLKKDTTDSLAFTQRLKFPAPVLTGKGVLCIGHTRSATSGSLTVDRSHPFVVGNTVFAHNGSLSNHRDLQKNQKNLDFTLSDSQIFTQLVEDTGLVSSVGEVEGSFSVVHYDRKHKRISFCRNSERPMFIAYSANKKNLYFGSEPGMISWICSRNSLKISEPTPIPEGEIWEYSLKDTEDMSSPSKITKVMLKPPRLSRHTLYWSEYEDIYYGRNPVLPWINNKSTQSKKEITSKALTSPADKRKEALVSSLAKTNILPHTWEVSGELHIGVIFETWTPSVWYRDDEHSLPKTGTLKGYCVSTLNRPPLEVLGLETVVTISRISEEDSRKYLHKVTTPVKIIHAKEISFGVLDILGEIVDGPLVTPKSIGVLQHRGYPQPTSNLYPVFVIDGWEPYPQNSKSLYGRLYGSVVSLVDFRVDFETTVFVYGIKREQAKTFLEVPQAYYRGKVTTVKKTLKNLALTVSGSTLKEAFE